MKEQDIEKDVIDVDEIEATDIKINPDYYIHKALLHAQVALTKDNMNQGLTQFRLLTEHLETLCKAANMVDDDYSKALEQYKKEDEDYNKAERGEIKSALLANKKIELIMANVFKNKVSTAALRG